MNQSLPTHRWPRAGRAGWGPGAPALCRVGTAAPARRPPSVRRGMSLLEVMLATVMLLATVMALSRVAFLAGVNAVGAEDRSQAQLLCQNILQEILAGARPMAEVSPEIFEGDNWVYMVAIEDVEGLEGVSLARITVQVDRLPDETARLPTEDEMAGYRLVHWVRTGKQPVAGMEGGEL